jgi:hypothetical protein
MQKTPTSHSCWYVRPVCCSEWPVSIGEEKFCLTKKKKKLPMIDNVPSRCTRKRFWQCRKQTLTGDSKYEINFSDNVIISEPFWIIIRHRSNFILESLIVVCFAPCQCFCLFVFFLLFLHPFNVLILFLKIYLYVVVNLFHESDFHWQEWKKILMKQNDTVWNFLKIIFWKDKIDYNKIIMSTKNN